MTIEQNLSAIRKWYDEWLKDSTSANPARNGRLVKVRCLMRVRPIGVGLGLGRAVSR